ncbi:cache domain-containing protein, partial [Caballeronia calidae]|uniref:cache domain-containing protein n=1 Tax=Caballeronia calidae TaxID=1777139 RepID=UPI000A842541
MNKFRIRPKLSPYHAVLLVLAGLLTLGFLTTSVASYIVSRDAIRQDLIDTELPLTSDNVYSEIQKSLVTPIIISTMMAHDTFVRDWIISGERDIGQITHYLSEIQHHYNAVTAYLISEDTKNYYQTKGFLKKISPTVAHDKWYFRTRSMDDPYVIDIDTDEANQKRLTIFINCQVFDYHGRFIGVTGVGLSVTTLIGMMDGYVERYRRNIYFADRSARLTLTGSNGGPAQARAGQSLQGKTGPGNPIERLPNSAGGNFEYWENGERHFVNVRYVPELKWYLMVDKSDTGLL